MPLKPYSMSSECWNPGLSDNFSLELETSLLIFPSLREFDDLYFLFAISFMKLKNFNKLLACDLTNLQLNTGSCIDLRLIIVPYLILLPKASSLFSPLDCGKFDCVSDGSEILYYVSKCIEIYFRIDLYIGFMMYRLLF